MKSIRLNSTDSGRPIIVCEEEAIPSPKPGEVLVRWKASSMNYHDYLVLTGGIPVANQRIPMSDGAGEIAALGAGVSQWKEGDRVLGLFFPDWQDGQPNRNNIAQISGESVDGFLTEYSCVQAEALCRMPENFSFGEAATLPCAGLTAFNGLIELGNLHAGKSVLVQGSGGVSIFALQIAEKVGAEIIATSSSDDKLRVMQSMGAVRGYNYQNDELWGKSIFKDTGGVDLVLDVGGGSTMVQSIEACAMNATILSIGILAGGRKGVITFPKLFFKFLQIKGFAVGSKSSLNRFIDFVEHHEIKPVIDRVFTMERLEEAIVYHESGGHFGKIVFEW